MTDKPTDKAKLADRSLPPADALTAASVPGKTVEANDEIDVSADKATKKEIADNPVVFEQGRTARRAGIAKADAPWAEDSNELSVWLAGYDHEDKVLGG